MAARRCANALGLRVIGSLGIILMAKQKGLVPSVKPIIEHLSRVGLYLDAGLVAKVLEMAGE
ncbi:MAG: DUF3368 domain-containing protein [Gammaproteobacteria bacterium]